MASGCIAGLSDLDSKGKMIMELLQPSKMTRSMLTQKIHSLESIIRIYREELEHRPETDVEMHGFFHDGKLYAYNTFVEAVEGIKGFYKNIMPDNVSLESLPYRIQTIYRRTDDKV